LAESSKPLSLLMLLIVADISFEYLFLKSFKILFLCFYF